MKTIQILFVMLFACTSTQSIYAQSDKYSRLKDSTPSLTFVSYICPMHPAESSDKPGKCNKCGMPLSKQVVESDTVRYSCSMHPEITSDKPGKCSRCGMALTQKTQAKTDIVNGYSCAMHPEVISDKPGKCSKCGMALTAVKPRKN